MCENSDLMLTPLHRRCDFGLEPWSLDEKIQIFEQQYRGWQIDISKKVAEGIKDSGFAVLSIAISYFQVIARFKGYRYSKDYFREFEHGLLDVFPEIQQECSQDADIIIARLWSSVRCGLYHNGLIYGRVNLTEEMKQPIGYNKDLDILYVNPRLLAYQLDIHFRSYIAQLKDTKDYKLKKDFENWFDGVIKEEDKNFEYAKLRRQKRRKKGRSISRE